MVSTVENAHICAADRNLPESRDIGIKVVQKIESFTMRAIDRDSKTTIHDASLRQASYQIWFLFE